MTDVVRQVIRCWPVSWPEQPNDYRYQLEVALGAGPTLTVVLKNPSLADGQRLDPTVGKVEAWARRHNFGCVLYVNLFAYRSPHPATLNRLTYAAAVGPENDVALRLAFQHCDRLVAAWGNPNGIDPLRYARRIDEVRQLMAAATDQRLSVVGSLTRAGHPRHGLHWNGDAQLAVWPDFGTDVT